MSGLIAIIIITWIAARLFRLPPISDVLGLLPPRRIAGLGGVLFLSVALCCASGYLVRSLMADEFFGFNQNLDLGELASGIAATVLSVLFEELLFRGVVLYLLIRKIGEKWAILISSLAFGALHLNVVSDWGNLPQIVLTLIYPFLLGLVLAYAFARHGSIILPIAIHLG